MLSLEQRKQLLRIARESIAAVLEGRSAPSDPPTDDPDLSRPSGAFVSLHTAGGELRGCIGSIAAVAPLARAVSSSAVNAAFRDPRFFPVRREELPALHIEISVMSPLEPVVDVGTIEVGRDGLIVQRNGNAGLLLPQVAGERGWDRETFLDQTCIKAGLSPDSWRSPGCRIEKFSAEVFSE